MKHHIHRALLLLSATALIPLAACQTTQGGTAGAHSSVVTGQAASGESLAMLESSYKRKSDDVRIATRYAHALRNADRLNRAAMVLSPFVTDTDDAPAGAYTEYAATMAAMGTYEEAEAHARKAILKDPENGQAYHVLGIALDAQGHHPQAEVAFRKALEHWDGDPAPVMNNLGLNLASQGFVDDALDTLRQAASLSPNRPEIERNLRIVSALQTQPPQEGVRLVPKPSRKPDETAQAEPAAEKATAQ
jgi:Flp pilus assembly protein TadD